MRFASGRGALRLWLLDGVGSGLGALRIVLARVAGHADGADDFPVNFQGQTSLDGTSSLKAEHA